MLNTIGRTGAPRNLNYRNGWDGFFEGKPFTTQSSLNWQQGWKAAQESVPMFIDVITATRDPGAPPVQTHRINYHSEKARKWLITHQWWALHHGYTVHIAAVEKEG